MRHNVKRKEKHGGSVAVISQFDKIKRKGKMAKSVEMMLGVMSRNMVRSRWVSSSGEKIRRLSI